MPCAIHLLAKQMRGLYICQPGAKLFRFAAPHPGPSQTRPHLHPARAGALHFCREIDVTGSVNQVDAVAFPLRCNGGGNDGDAAFAFFGHPVSDSGAVINIAKAISLAGIK
jgi:hypothetical protein